MDKSLLDRFASLEILARGRLFSTRPGRHDSRSLGGSGAFADQVSLLDHPDPRRIDVRASLFDPFETIRVRRYRQAVTARVVVILDTSGSMGVAGRGDRRSLAVAISAGLARAVEVSSDRYGLVTGRDDDPYWPPLKRRGLAGEVADFLERIPFDDDGDDRLDRAAERLGSTRSVVFLVSDFTQPLERIAALLDALAGHDLRPVVLRDSRLEDPHPRLGLVELEDLETGRLRLALMRPALAKRIRQHVAERLDSLESLFADRDLQPIHLVDRIDVDCLFDEIRMGGGR